MSSLSQDPKTAHDGKAEDFISKPEEPSEVLIWKVSILRLRLWMVCSQQYEHKQTSQASPFDHQPQHLTDLSD